jgi:hypothetical protein
MTKDGMKQLDRRRCCFHGFCFIVPTVIDREILLVNLIFGGFGRLGWRLRAQNLRYGFIVSYGTSDELSALDTKGAYWSLRPSPYPCIRLPSVWPTRMASPRSETSLWFHCILRNVRRAVSIISERSILVFNIVTISISSYSASVCLADSNGVFAL